MASIDWSSRITAYLNLGPDTTRDRGSILATIGSAVQAAIERRIDRHFELREHTEAYDGHDKRTLFLKHQPVVDVKQVKINGTPFVVGDPTKDEWPIGPLCIDGKSGIAFTNGMTFPRGKMNVVVRYVAGYVEPPEDLITAGTQWAALVFKESRACIHLVPFANASLS
jgi:hypothetical protein